MLGDKWPEGKTRELDANRLMIRITRQAIHGLCYQELPTTPPMTRKGRVRAPHPVLGDDGVYCSRGTAL